MESKCLKYSVKELDLTVLSFIPVILSPFDAIPVTNEIEPVIDIVERLSEVPFGPQE